MSRGYFIPADGECQVVQVDGSEWGSDAKLPTIRETLGCKWLRAIAVDGLPALVLLADEEGKLKPNNRNDRATKLAGRSLADDDFIVGPALVLAVQDDNWVGLTEDEFFQLAARLVGDERITLANRQSIQIEGE